MHKEYLYKPSDVLRHDRELPVSFIPHPLFQLDFMPRAVELTEQRPSRSRRAQIAGAANVLPLEVLLVVRGQSAERKAFQEALSQPP